MKDKRKQTRIQLEILAITVVDTFLGLPANCFVNDVTRKMTRVFLEICFSPHSAT